MASKPQHNKSLVSGTIGAFRLESKIDTQKAPPPPRVLVRHPCGLTPMRASKRQQLCNLSIHRLSVLPTTKKGVQNLVE